MSQASQGKASLIIDSSVCNSEVGHRSNKSIGLGFYLLWGAKIFFVVLRSWQSQWHFSSFIGQAQNLFPLSILFEKSGALKLPCINFALTGTPMFFFNCYFSLVYAGHRCHSLGYCQWSWSLPVKISLQMSLMLILQFGFDWAFEWNLNWYR